MPDWNAEHFQDKQPASQKAHLWTSNTDMQMLHNLSQCMEATYALNSTPTEDSFSNYFSKMNENLHRFPQSSLFTLYRRKKTTTSFPGSVGEDPGNEVDKTIIIFSWKRNEAPFHHFIVHDIIFFLFIIHNKWNFSMLYTLYTDLLLHYNSYLQYDAINLISKLAYFDSNHTVLNKVTIIMVILYMK